MGVMIRGPSDEEPVGAGADGASLDAMGASVGDGSTFVTEYFAEDEATVLEADVEDEAIALDERIDVDIALDVGMDVDSRTLEMTDGVAYADEEVGATDDETTCDDRTAEDSAGVSTGADDDEGKTVVYCVTMTTGGTGSEVEGSNSADGDASTEDCTAEEAGTAGTAVAAELEAKTEDTSVLDFSAEDSAELAVETASEAAGVGKTVVYKVSITTRRDDVVIVEFSGAMATELEAKTDDAAELTGAAEGDACETDATRDELTRAPAVELTRALLGAAVP